MAGCLKCQGTFECPSCHPGAKFQSASSDVGKLSEPCPEKCTASVLVRDSDSGKGVDGVTVAGLSGTPKTDANGLAHFKGLDPGALTAKLSLAGLEARYALPRPGADKQTKTVAAAGYGFFVFELDPLTSLEVTVARSDRDGLGVKDASVLLTEEGRAQVTKTTAGEDGKVLFEKVRKGKVELKLELKGSAKERFHVSERFDEQTRATALLASRGVELDLSKAKNEAKFVVTPQIYLKLKFKDPEGTVRAFPKDFPLAVVFSPSGTKIDAKVQDDEGNLRFVAAKDQTHFTIKFDAEGARLLSVAKDATKVELVVGATEEQMQKLAVAQARFFALPNKWSLVHAGWQTANVAVPKDGKVAIPLEGVGTESAPGELTLLPKVQHARFTFHDRKYGRVDHLKKQVGIPAVVLKAARKGDDANGVPVDPVAGTHDAIGAWMLSPGDNAAACQVLPWIVTKNDAGDDLPKLNNKMVLEFGWPDGFVVSNGPGAAERVIATIPDGDPRRLPTKDRHKYYDLPARWMSKCYYTRLPGGDADATKNKFFDKLTEAEVDGSLALGGLLSFSLDDIVLVKDDDQDLKDRTRTNTTKALSGHSRVAILYLDAGDLFKVKVHDPRPEAEGIFHSKTLFARAEAHRNVLVDYPWAARAVLFCSGVYDIYDKRTVNPDFSKKQMCGARAAFLKDEHVSAVRKFSQGTDVGKGYVHRTRVFELYYLHYGESDGTTVYSALLTYWSAYIFATAARKPAWPGPGTDPLHGVALTNNEADTDLFRGPSLSRAMVRWNEKDYQFEEADDKTAYKIKSFVLFEGKEVKTGPGFFAAVGGVPHCSMAIGSDPDESWATETIMLMAKDDHDVEADWGSDVRTADLDGTTRPRRVMAHEAGHAALGLWDDYITQKWLWLPRYWDIDDQELTPQRYLGVAYYRDDASIMNVNRSPRLRMYWGRANWLNDESAAHGDLNKFLGARRFQVTYAGPTGKLKYHRDEPSRNIYAPTHQAAELALGHQGAATLYLYKLGDDEFSRQTNNASYKGMLVIEQRICVAFRTGLTPDVDHWEPATAYAVGKSVEWEAQFYVCVAAHTSGDANKPGSAQWLLLDPTAGLYVWGAGTDCDPGEWFTDSGQAYVCRSAHKSGSRVASFFAPSSAPAWVSAFWRKVIDVPGAYAAGTAYQSGDRCTDGGDELVCVTPHTAGTAAADVLAGRLIGCAHRPKPWTDDEKEVYVPAVDTALKNLLEAGGVGKFKLVATGGGDFSPCYMRYFAQWGGKAATTDPDPATTQYAFDVVHGGGLKCFHPGARTVKLGTETSKETIARYLFGKLSDDATVRATQAATGALVAADFEPLVKWMQDRVPGKTFQVQAI